MAKKKKTESKLEKKINGGVSALIIFIYAVTIGAAVVREILDRKQTKQ